MDENLEQAIVWYLHETDFSYWKIAKILDTTANYVKQVHVQEYTNIKDNLDGIHEEHPQFKPEWCENCQAYVYKPCIACRCRESGRA